MVEHVCVPFVQYYEGTYRVVWACPACPEKIWMTETECKTHLTKIPWLWIIAGAVVLGVILYAARK